MDLVLLKPGNDQIVGESLIQGELAGGNKDDLSKCIELVSIHYSMKQQITTDVSNSARTSGRPELTDITAIKYFDQASTTLYKHCLAAIPLDTGKADEYTKIYLCRNSNDTIANIMTIELKDAIISSIECQSHPNDMPTEQLTINFTAVNWIYNSQLNNMSDGGVKVAGWTVSENHGMPPAPK